MTPSTIKELFDQIQIDADNQIIFNRGLYEKKTNKIIHKEIKDKIDKIKKEYCLNKKEYCLDKWFTKDDISDILTEFKLGLER